MARAIATCPWRATIRNMSRRESGGYLHSTEALHRVSSAETQVNRSVYSRRRENVRRDLTAIQFQFAKSPFAGGTTSVRRVMCSSPRAARARYVPVPKPAAAPYLDSGRRCIEPFFGPSFFEQINSTLPSSRRHGRIQHGFHCIIRRICTYRQTVSRQARLHFSASNTGGLPGVIALTGQMPKQASQPKTVLECRQRSGSNVTLERSIEANRSAVSSRLKPYLLGIST